MSTASRLATITSAAGCLLYLVLAAGTTAADPLWPQWALDGVPVKPAPSSAGTAVPVADEAGGTFVVWLDRSPGTSTDHVRVTHLRSDGTRDAAWPADGIDAGTFSGRWFAAPDHAGGVYVLVGTSPSFRVFRIHSDGTIDPSWAANGGVEVAVGYPSGIGVDLSGGVWTAVPYDGSFCIPGAPGHCFFSWGIRVERLRPDGSFVPGWSPPGVRMLVSSTSLVEFGIEAYAPLANAIRFQLRYSIFDRSFQAAGYGIFECGPDSSGRMILDKSSTSDFFAGVSASDELGNAFLGFGDFLSTQFRRWSAGAVWNPPWFYPVTGGAAIVPGAAAPDGAGGLFARTDFNAGFGPTAFRLNHLLPNGQSDARWPATGLALDGVGGNSVALQRMISDRRGGCFITWEDHRVAGDADVYALRLAQDGSAPDGWQPTGMPISALSGSRQIDPYSCTDERGDLFVVWRDERAGPTNLFAQKLSFSSPVATTVQGSSGRVVNGRVELEWTLASAPASDLVVERSDESGWVMLGTLLPGGQRDRWRFIDVRPPELPAASYRLHETHSGWAGGELRVELSRPRSLLVTGPLPHPWVRGSRFALQAPGSAPVHLVIVDAQGRRVLERNQPAGGEATLDWPEIDRLSAGLYWLVASPGAQQARVRFVVTR